MVRLRAMTEPEFRAFLERSVPDYAHDKVQVGAWTAGEALEKARQVYADLLTQGLHTADQYLYTIELEGRPVGSLWLALKRRPGRASGFIYDVFVDAAYRRRGVARAALQLLDVEASRLGASTLALHVFGFNAGARTLYEQLGYEITDINMSKKLGEREATHG